MASHRGSAGPRRGDRATFSGGVGDVGVCGVCGVAVPRPLPSGDRHGGAVGGGGTRKGEEVVVEKGEEVVMEKGEEVVMEKGEEVVKEKGEEVVMEKGEEVVKEKSEELEDEKGDEVKEKGEEVEDEKGDSEEVVASSSHAVSKRQRSHTGRGSLPHLELEKKSPVFGRGVWWKKQRSDWGPLSSSKRLYPEKYVWDTASEDTASENDDNFPSTQSQ